MTLDGFAGTEDRDVSWVFPYLDEEVEAWIAGLLRQADTQPIGLVNYGEQAAHWPR